MRNLSLSFVVVCACLVPACTSGRGSAPRSLPPRRYRRTLAVVNGVRITRRR